NTPVPTNGGVRPPPGVLSKSIVMIATAPALEAGARDPRKKSKNFIRIDSYPPALLVEKTDKNNSQSLFEGRASAVRGAMPGPPVPAIPWRRLYCRGRGSPPGKPL